MTVEKHGTKTVKQGSLLSLMKEELSSYRTETIPGLPPFQGGAIGYFSYDIVREIEQIPEYAEDDLELPDLYFMLFHDVFVYEHGTQKLWMIVHGPTEAELDERLFHYKKKWTAPVTQKKWERQSSKGAGNLHSSLSKERFCEAVSRIQEYIAAGDVFQVNLSLRQSREMRSEPLHVYEELRKLNPSPYMAFCKRRIFN